MGILDLIKGKKGQDYLSLIQEGEYEAAEMLLEKLSKENPGDTFLYMKLAECHESLGKINEAVACLQKVVQIYTEDGYVAKAVAVQKKIARIKPELSRSTSKILAENVEECKQRKDWSEVSLPPFFTLFSKDELEEILSEGVELHEFTVGDTVIREGDDGNSMFTIVEGKVEVYTMGPGDKKIRLAEMGPGDFFGEGSLLTSKPRTATIESLGETQLLEFPREKMDEIIARYPNVQDILKEFYENRANDTVEAMLQQLKG